MLTDSEMMHMLCYRDDVHCQDTCECVQNVHVSNVIF